MAACSMKTVLSSKRGSVCHLSLDIGTIWERYVGICIHFPAGTPPFVLRLVDDHGVVITGTYDPPSIRFGFPFEAPSPPHGMQPCHAHCEWWQSVVEPPQLLPAIASPTCALKNFSTISSPSFHLTKNTRSLRPVRVPRLPAYLFTHWQYTVYVPRLPGPQLLVSFVVVNAGMLPQAR